MKTATLLAGILSLIAVGVLSRSVFALEKPQYNLLSKSGKLEIRNYEPVMVASTSLSGEYRQQTRNGFRIIANYIFGGNQESQPQHSDRPDRLADQGRSLPSAAGPSRLQRRADRRHPLHRG